jgi:hypothetical protein
MNMSIGKLGIKIDYDRDVENSSRVFHAMGDMIDGVNEVHQAVLDSVGLGISLSSKLDRTIEGSLIGVQIQSVRANGTKEIVEKKRGIIDRIMARTEAFLGEPRVIDNASQIQDIVDGYQIDLEDAFELSHSEEFNVTHIDTYRVAKGFEKIFKANRSRLTENDKVYFGSKSNSNLPNVNFSHESYFAKTADELFTSRKAYSHSKYIIGISKADYAGDVWGFHWLTANMKGRRDFSAKIQHKEWLERWFDGKVSIYPGYGLQVDIDIYINSNKKRDKQAIITHIYGVIPKKDMDQIEMGYDKNDA